MGRDVTSRLECRNTALFQSTLPAWGETQTTDHRPQRDFNPLSPHGERPEDYKTPTNQPLDFNPLSPHGERPTAGR